LQSWDFGIWDVYVHRTYDLIPELRQAGQVGTHDKPEQEREGVPWRTGVEHSRRDGLRACKLACGVRNRNAQVLPELRRDHAVVRRPCRSCPSASGLMVARRDASQAYANGRYDAAMKAALTAAGGTGFTYPACTAPAFSAGSSYSAGQQVTYNGWIWQAKWYASDTPAASFTGDWNPGACGVAGWAGRLTRCGYAVSACGGAPIAPSSSKSTTTPTPTPTSKPGTTTKPTTTSTSSGGGGGGSCAGVAAWTSSQAYTGGAEVTYR
jgi:hypothetical protein